MKRALIIVGFWLLASPARAESELSVAFPVRAEPELGVAFKGGPNAATLAEDYRVTRYGFSGGLAGHLQWPLLDPFSLAGQVELLYTPRGAEVLFEGRHLGKFREHYLDLTLAARPAVRLGPVSLYLLLGGGLNILLSANKDDAGVNVDITDDLRRIDVSLLVGAGVAQHFSSRGPGPLRLGTVFLEGRYDHGLIDTVPGDSGGGFKNRTTSLMLGLSFALGAGTATAQPASPSAPSGPPSPAAAAE